VKATPASYKLPLSVQQLPAVCARLDPNDVTDAQTKAVILSCFFCLLRISNVTVPHATGWDPAKALLRRDISFYPDGCVLRFRWSKTIQFHEKTLDITLPKIHCASIWPTRAILRFLFLARQLPEPTPAFAIQGVDGRIHPNTQTAMRQKFQALCTAVGLSPADFNTHSLRRSGACFLLANGVRSELSR